MEKGTDLPKTNAPDPGWGYANGWWLSEKLRRLGTFDVSLAAEIKTGNNKMAKKRHKELKAAVEGFTTDYDFEPGKTHIGITVRAFGGSRKLSVSSSPSCPHSLNQFKRDLKKVMYELEEGLEPGAMWAKS